MHELEAPAAALAVELHASTLDHVEVCALGRTTLVASGRSWTVCALDVGEARQFAAMAGLERTVLHARAEKGRIRLTASSQSWARTMTVLPVLGRVGW